MILIFKGFLVWLLMNFFALFLISKRKDKVAIYSEMKSFVSDKDKRLAFIGVFILYLYLPFTIIISLNHLSKRNGKR
jgi:hypothetical protein